MFPIRDHNPSTRTPFVTYALMATNIVVFLSYQSVMLDPVATMALFDTWALRPVEVMAGNKPHTIITSMFLHGGWMHIIGNMLFLWIFGDNLEDEMGHGGFVLFYLASGIGAAVAQIAAAPYSPVPMVGASGAIAGVMGGYLLLFPRAKVDVLFIIVVFIRIIPIPAWIMLGLWFALQLFNGVGTDTSGGGVAYWAHAGGFIVGMVLTLPLFFRLGGPAFWARTDGHPDHPEAKYPLQRSNVPKVGRRR
ncbi:rhomboid family intramembrane serine protease [Lacimonas salitolerans]|uniref:Rhomboid family intramembrane serine protease n=1 Tax=Lacimonas salitolerans TaxID=1323750 RepID=A0ABW4EG35_9RHOB